jgi:hypothetical protein
MAGASDFCAHAMVIHFNDWRIMDFLKILLWQLVAKLDKRVPQGKFQKIQIAS